MTAHDELAEVIAERLGMWFIDKYHADYLATCLNTGTEPLDWQPHAGHMAQARANGERQAALILDALAEHPALLVQWLSGAGALERMSWMNEAGTWFCPMPTPTCDVPVFRVADRPGVANQTAEVSAHGS